MKYLALALILAGCAGKKDEALSPAGSGPAPAAVAVSQLAKSESLTEADGVAAASAAVKAGIKIPAATSQRCWEREIMRPNLREACLLAWAAVGEPSKMLTEVLRTSLDGGATSRAIRLASARRQDFILSLTPTDLAFLLTTLNDEPAWVRERAVLSSMIFSAATLSEKQLIFTAMKPAGVEGAPLSVGLSMSLSHALGFSFAGQAQLEAACPKRVASVALTRCLRILSTMGTFNHAWYPELASLLPHKSDEAVSAFKRSFPTRALNFQ